MATSWVKALHCRSNAPDDVLLPPQPTPNKHPLLPLNCRGTSHALLDAISHLPPKKQPNKDPAFNPPNTNTPRPKPTDTHRRSTNKDPAFHHPTTKKQKPTSTHTPKDPTFHLPIATKPQLASPSPTRPVVNTSPFPTLAELPPHHPSRRVIELIFNSSWSRPNSSSPFPGEIQVLFKVHNPARTVAMFEEYRDAVRSLAGTGAHARCAADGNEMMRFHSPEATWWSQTKIRDEPICHGGVTCGPRGAVRTFDGSGGAHRSVAGDGVGGRSRAMLVCRVITGRIRCVPDYGSDCEPHCGYESVYAGKGELVVFDQRAVLPCFLIIYKI